MNMSTSINSLISKLSTENLLSYLRAQDLNLDNEDLELLRKSKISGSSFLYFTKEDFYRNGLASGPTIAILQLISDINHVIKKIGDLKDDEKKIISQIRKFALLETDISNEDSSLLEEILSGNLEGFVDKILNYHDKKKSFRSFRDYNENAFHTAVECLLSSIYYFSEMQLIVEAKRDKKFKYGFVDLFIFDKNQGIFSAVFELKLFNLIGLYWGEVGSSKNNPNYNSLLALNENLKNEREDKLLKRDYIYWCKDTSKYKSIKVQTIVENGFMQLDKYIKTISNGKANNSTGISDFRIKIESGKSFLRCFLVVSMGTRRVLVRHKFKSVDYQFFRKI